jgi:hypothetical protein
LTDHPTSNSLSTGTPSAVTRRLVSAAIPTIATSSAYSASDLLAQRELGPCACGQESEVPLSPDPADQVATDEHDETLAPFDIRHRPRPLL